MKNGAFNPDNARGSQFSTKSCSLHLSSKGPAVREDMFKRPRGHSPAIAPASGSQWEVVTADPEPVSNTDDSASDRVSEEDLAPDLSLPATRARRSVIAALPYWCVTYMHAMSGCLHVGNSEERLLCGRKMSDRYIKTDIVELDEGRPHCRQCWTHTSLQE